DCKDGATVCKNGVWQPCVGDVRPMIPEICTIPGSNPACDGIKCSDATWSALFGAPGDSAYVSGMAIDPQGNIVLAGNLKGTMNLSPRITPTNSSIQDAWIAKFDPMGKPIWGRRFGVAGGSNQTAVTGVAIDASGANIAMTGALYGSTDFGKGNLV